MLNLVSTKLCPYGQRSAIVLNHKQIPHEVQFIDLTEPPSWFSDVSPLKKVPVLLVKGQAIFGSSTIGEFLDETYPCTLHPDDALSRATNRSWIDFGGDCMTDMVEMALSASQDGYKEARLRLWQKFDRLEAVLGNGPFFNGADFSLVDAAYAPMFQRLDFIEALCPGVYRAQQHPRLVKWKVQLTTVDSVRESFVPELQNLFHALMRKRSSYVSKFL